MREALWGYDFNPRDRFSSKKGCDDSAGWTRQTSDLWCANCHYSVPNFAPRLITQVELSRWNPMTSASGVEGLLRD